MTDIEKLIAAADAPAGFQPFGLNEGGGDAAPTDGFAVTIAPLFITMRDEMPIFGFRVMEKHCNPMMICHGGMMMAVMDMALGIATHAVSKTTKFTPSVNLTYDFLKPAPLGIWLESRIEMIEARKRLAFGNAYLEGPDGPVMRCNGIMKIPSENGQDLGAKALDFSTVSKS